MGRTTTATSRLFTPASRPRANDPRRIHLHLGRGNQLRTTLVLADDVLREYAEDLVERHRIYRTLIEGGCLVLTQNRGFEDFERTLKDAGVERLVAEQATLFACCRARAQPAADGATQSWTRLPHPRSSGRGTAALGERIQQADRTGMTTERH